MSQSNVIKVKNLSKHFDIIKAVDDISFSVRHGEIFGFLGPNGAGKTTTIRMLTGVLKPTAGDITIYGRNAWKNQIAVKQIMGNVPEMANVYMDLTGIQNLTFIGEVYGLSKHEREKKAEKLLKKFELYKRKDALAKKYSKGMKQRLLLCMALMSDPKILFLDEPTSGLDVQSSIIIKNLIKQYNKEGMTIFLTTHNMNVANEMCNRIAIINKGEIIQLDTLENLRRLGKKYQVINLYLSDPVDHSDLNALRGIEEVKKVKSYYHIIVKDLNEAISQIVGYLKDKNIKIKKLDTPEPTLEEIFVKLINRGEEN